MSLGEKTENVMSEKMLGKNFMYVVMKFDFFWYRLEEKQQKASKKKKLFDMHCESAYKFECWTCVGKVFGVKRWNKFDFERRKNFFFLCFSFKVFWWVEGRKSLTHVWVWRSIEMDMGEVWKCWKKSKDGKF